MKAYAIHAVSRLMTWRRGVAWAVLWCAALALGAQQQIEVTDTLRLTTDAELADGLFMEALVAEERGAGGESEAYFMLQQALALQSDHVGALYELAKLEYGLRNDSLACLYLERAVACDTTNYWLRQELASLYVQMGREAEGIAALESLAAQYPRKSELLLQLSDMYARGGDYEGMLRVMERVELLEGKSEETSMAKFRCYVRLGEEEKAFAEMQELAEEYPNDVRYGVLIGDLQLDAGHLEEAKATYDRLLQEHPNNANVLLALSNYYSTTGEDSLYRLTREQLLLHESLNAEVRYRFMHAMVMSTLSEGSDTTEVMSLFRLLLARPQEDTELCELCVRYMVTKDAPDEQVEAVLRQMLEIDAECDLARSELLSRAINRMETDEIERLCRTAVQFNSANALYYYYLGLVLYQQGEDEEALEVMRKGLGRLDAKSNLTMIVNMHAICGDIYHKLGDDAAAFAAYDSCLLYRPNDAMVLNNYAYYLSLRGQDLERAERMSLKSIEQERKTSGENATYLDTYAWILFMQKRYEQARAVMERVLSIYGYLPGELTDSTEQRDPNIVEHAGDIYSKLSQPEQALYYWQEAAALFADSEEDDKEAALQRVATKIKKKKFIDY